MKEKLLSSLFKENIRSRRESPRLGSKIIAKIELLEILPKHKLIPCMKNNERIEYAKAAKLKGD